MIQVQIASQITPLGVQGIRWVLVDPTDGGASAGPTPADLLSAAISPAVPLAERSLLSAGVLKLGLTGLGLALALWAAQAWLGAPTAPGLAPTPPASTPPPALRAPETPVAPTAPAAPADPAAPTAPVAPAAVAAPWITAELR